MDCSDCLIPFLNSLEVILSLAYVNVARPLPTRLLLESSAVEPLAQVLSFKHALAPPLQLARIRRLLLMLLVVYIDQFHKTRFFLRE
jgi:hypothetical protein